MSDRRTYVIQARVLIVKHLREFTPRYRYPRDEFDQLVRVLEHLDIVLGNGASITCPYCGWTSYHPGDIQACYCRNCHEDHEAMRLKRLLEA